MGVQAAVNEEIEVSELPMMIYVYMTIIALVFSPIAIPRDAGLLCAADFGDFHGLLVYGSAGNRPDRGNIAGDGAGGWLGVDYAFYIYNRIQYHFSEGP